MWSTTVSSISTATIPSGKCPEIIRNEKPIKNCSINQYFHPDTNFDEAWAFRVLQMPFPEEQKPQPVSNSNESLLCQQNVEAQKADYSKWIAKYLQNICLTLTEQRHDFSKNVCLKNLAIRNFNQSWCSNKTIRHINISEFDKIIQRFFCYPNVIVVLPSHRATDMKILRKYLDNGIKLFHLNLRLGTRKIHKHTLAHLTSAVNNRENVHIGLMIEITQSEVRTGMVQNNRAVFLERDSKVILTADRRYTYKCSHRAIYINFCNTLAQFQIDDDVRIGQRIEVKVIRIFNTSCECVVTQNGLLESDMGIRLPSRMNFVTSCLPSQEEKEDICEALDLDCDFLVCPCPLKLSTLMYINEQLKKRNKKALKYAKVTLDKIWTNEELDTVIKNYDGLWIKGKQINKTRNYIISECMQQRKQIICSGFVDGEGVNIPNHDEAKKLFLIYPDAIAVKCQDIEPTKVRYLIQKSYSDLNHMIATFSLKYLVDDHIENILIRYVIASIFRFKTIQFIVVSNDTGRTIFSLANRRPLVPVIACVGSIHLARKCAILRHVYALYTKSKEISSECYSWNEVLSFRLENALQFAKRMLGTYLEVDSFIFCYSSRHGMDYCDSYRILKINRDI